MLMGFSPFCPPWNSTALLKPLEDGNMSLQGKEAFPHLPGKINPSRGRKKGERKGIGGALKLFSRYLPQPQTSPLVTSL